MWNAHNCQKLTWPYNQYLSSLHICRAFIYKYMWTLCVYGPCVVICLALRWHFNLNSSWLLQKCSIFFLPCGENNSGKKRTMMKFIYANIAELIYGHGWFNGREMVAAWWFFYWRPCRGRDSLRIVKLAGECFWQCQIGSKTVY